MRPRILTAGRICSCDRSLLRPGDRADLADSAAPCSAACWFSASPLPARGDGPAASFGPLLAINVQDFLRVAVRRRLLSE